MSPQAKARAKPDHQLELQVVPLREMGYSVMRICEQLGLEKTSDWAAVQMICDAKGLMRYRKGGPGISGPTKPGPNRSQVKLA